MSWLQRQQQKLQERREGQKKTQQESAFLIKELKTSLERARSGGTETTDGYASDVNSLLCSETSREPSPAKQQIYQVPLQVEERGPVQQESKIQQSSFQNSDLRGANSETRARSSSEVGTRSSESGFHSSESSSQQQGYSSVQMSESSNQQIYSSVQKRSMTPSMSSKKAAELKSLLNRQRSDTSYDRSWPGVQRRRQDSESEAELSMLRTNGAQNGSCGSIDSAGMLCGGSRPITPAFPQVPGTPLFNHSSNGLQTSTLPPKPPGSALLQGNRHNSRPDLTYRAPSPAGSFYQADPNLSSRRGSVSSEPTDVAASHVRLVKENHKWWYKPHITREDAINLLKSQSPGTFIVRDSNTFPDSFGLALKVATPPQNGQQQRSNGQQSSEELVRHFLIEPTSKGVKLKGYSNEPVFASLSALIYQHTLTPLALPIRLVLPQADLGPAGISAEPSASTQMQQLLQQGAACNVHYLFSMDTDQLTGPQAVRKTVSQLFLTRPVPSPTTVHFKVSGQGITLTDNARKLFFRKHYNVSQISHCGVDPEDRRWSLKSADGSLSAPNKLFAFVARKAASRACNQCHVFAELDLDQPARAIVNFVNKLMMSTSNGSTGRPADMV